MELRSLNNKTVTQKVKSEIKSILDVNDNGDMSRREWRKNQINLISNNRTCETFFLNLYLALRIGVNLIGRILFVSIISKMKTFNIDKSDMLETWTCFGGGDADHYHIFGAALRYNYFGKHILGLQTVILCIETSHSNFLYIMFCHE